MQNNADKPNFSALFQSLKFREKSPFLSPYSEDFLLSTGFANTLNNISQVSIRTQFEIVFKVADNAADLQSRADDLSASSFHENSCVQSELEAARTGLVRMVWILHGKTWQNQVIFVHE